MRVWAWLPFWLIAAGHEQKGVRGSEYFFQRKYGAFPPFIENVL